MSQGGSVEGPGAIAVVDRGFDLAVEGLRIRFEAVEQSGVGVMGRGVTSGGSAAGGLAAADRRGVAIRGSM